jgi:hypothetical protein
MMAKKKVPTIDERLDRLVERHEALSQTVELVAHMQLQTSKNLDRLERLFHFVGAGHNKRITKLERRVS